nr:MAG TPA: hypothetical protein [Caudoviricetes sp.]
MQLPARGLVSGEQLGCHGDYISGSFALARAPVVHGAKRDAEPGGELGVRKGILFTQAADGGVRQIVDAAEEGQTICWNVCVVRVEPHVVAGQVGDESLTVAETIGRGAEIIAGMRVEHGAPQ